MRTRLVFTLKLALRSPFLFRCPGGALFGIDAAPLRDAEGHPLIPADQLRGVLLEALTDISAAAPSVLSAADLTDLFGRGAADAREDASAAAGDAFAPMRANILCDDLRATGTWTPSQAVRVAIEPEAGAARAGFLQIVALVAPPNAEVIFEGSLVVFARAGSEKKIETALKRAWALIGPIGAQKSVGFGAVVAAQSSIVLTRATQVVVPAAATHDALPVTYRMYFDRPFLIDADRQANNLYVGSEIVPGAVVKGALARRLTLGDEDPEKGRFATLLAGTIVSHAFPENADGVLTAHPLPLSLVAVKQDEEFLFADTLGLGEGKGTLLASRPALYAPDWKDGWAAKARDRLGLPRLPDTDQIGQVLRVHTAIDPKRGIAADGKLFATAARSHRMADPDTGAATGPTRAWRLSVTPPKAAEPTDWAALLALLEAGLDGIGRTGASVSFKRMDTPDPVAVVERDGRVAIMLTTPAILFDVAPRQTAREAYAGYWRDHLGGATLIDHVASQRLAGGYTARRHRAYASGYVPFVLTEAGAVFLLEGADRDTLEELMRTGLPLPTLDGRQPDWTTCPYVPENGYGAFTADHFARVAMLGEVKHG